MRIVILKNLSLVFKGNISFKVLLPKMWFKKCLSVYKAIFIIGPIFFY